MLHEEQQTGTVISGHIPWTCLQLTPLDCRLEKVDDSVIESGRVTAEVIGYVQRTGLGSGSMAWSILIIGW